VVLMRGALPLIRGAGQQCPLRYSEIELQVRVREPKMPLNSRSRVRAPFAAGLDLPPPSRAIALREVGDAFAHATKIAAESGAGTLLHVGRFDRIEFAVVLEPEEPLRTDSAPRRPHFSHSTLSTWSLPTRSRKVMAPSRGITTTLRERQGLHVIQGVRLRPQHPRQMPRSFFLRSSSIFFIA
jgi:hypothetical protein